MPWRMTQIGVARRRLLTAMIGVLTLCGAHVASAQVPWALGRWQGKGTFYLNWENQDDKAAHTKYETILFQERLWLRNTGAYIVDPRLVSLNLGGAFGLSQEDGLSVDNSPLRVGNGTLYDYALESLFMSDSAYPLTLFANRDENTLTQGFGTQSDVTFETHGGVWELREANGLEGYGLRNFSSLLDVHQEILKENSEVFGAPNQRDETHNIVHYHGHKGGETSDFDLGYDLNDVHDPLNPTDVFQSNSVRGTYSLDFGPTLNRRLDSGVYYFKRTGDSPGTNLVLGETLRIDHHQDFATTYRYNFSQSDTDGGVTTTNVANFELLDRLYRTLTHTADAWATRQDFSTGSTTAGGGRTGLTYHRNLPWNGQCFLDTALGYQVDSNSFSSPALQVVDEPHTAPVPLGAGAGFTLNNPFVQTATIVMVDVRGGARLPTTLNVDYVISPLGNYTEIIPLPGSPVIRPGDPLEVSYTYDVAPDVTYSTTTLNGRLGVDFPLLAASYEHLLSDQTRLAGTATPEFLTNSNLDRLKLELRDEWDDVRAQSSAAYDILRSTILNSDTWGFDQSVAYQPRTEILAQVSGDQFFIDYPGQGRHSESYLFRATVDWLTPVGVTVSTIAGYRAYYDTAVPSNDIIDAGLRLRWVYQSLEVIPSFTWASYQHQSDDARAELRIVRNLF